MTLNLYMRKGGQFVWQRVLVLFMIVPGSCVLGAHTRYYVDGARGDNAHDGRTRPTAWKTVSRVNSATLEGGDTVFFRKGGMWREQLTVYRSGSPGKPLVFASYGIGPNPIINGSTLLTSGWVNHGDNVWKHAFVPTAPGSQDGGKLSNVFFDNTRGVEVGSIQSVNSPGTWYHDQERMLYVYSIADPATAFRHPGIEASDRYCIVPNGNSHLVFDGIDVTKANSGGIWSSGYGNDLTVKNLDISFNGMSGIYSNTNSTVLIGCSIHDNGVGRHDHGAYFKGDSMLVERCRASRNAGAGIDFTNCSGTVRYNTCDSNGIIRNFRAASWGFGINLVPLPGQTINCYYNLIFDNFGHGVWASDGGSVGLYNNVIARTKHSSDAAGLTVTSSMGALAAKNNIFYAQDPGCTDIYVVASSARIVLDYNEYFGTEGTSISWMGTSYSTSQFSDFRSETGQEAHGFVADPQFVDPARNNFMPRTSSPAKGAGIHIGLTVDLVGTSVPVGPRVDVGAMVIR